MDLVSSQPFWLLKDGLPALYPPLERDSHCDVAVIGAGITGALVAEKLTSAGHKVIVLDRRDVATGSTSASTALLQYEIDRHLIELEEQYGEELARTAYLACYESIPLLAEAVKRGGHVHDRTSITAVEVTRSGVTLRTDRGPVVRAKRLVVAAGYEAGKFIDLRGRVDLNSSFALASEPLAPGTGWWRGAMIWESSRPYLYCREVSDGRILVGGDDVPFRTPPARDGMVSAKASRLERRFRKMMPALEWEPAFSWAGTFAETRDGLAYIGNCRDHPLCYFALGFGGNGIVFSVIAAEIICDDLAGKMHSWAKAVRFDR